MRLSFLFLFSILLIVGACVYNVSTQYQVLNKKVQRFVSQSEQEKENIRVLQAEWAFLTNPVRMEKLATEHFGLQAMGGEQLVAMNNIPLRSAMETQEEPVMIAKNQEAAPQVVAQQAPTVEETAQAAAMPAAMPLPTLTATPVSAVSGQ